MVIFIHEVTDALCLLTATVVSQDVTACTDRTHNRQTASLVRWRSLSVYEMSCHFYTAFISGQSTGVPVLILIFSNWHTFAQDDLGEAPGALGVP